MRWIDCIFLVLASEDKYFDSKQILDKISELNLKDVKKNAIAIISQAINEYLKRSSFCAIKIIKGKSNQYYLDRNIFKTSTRSVSELNVPINALTVSKVFEQNSSLERILKLQITKVELAIGKANEAESSKTFCFDIDEMVFVNIVKEKKTGRVTWFTTAKSDKHQKFNILFIGFGKRIENVTNAINSIENSIDKVKEAFEVEKGKRESYNAWELASNIHLDEEKAQIDNKEILLNNKGIASLTQLNNLSFYKKGFGNEIMNFELKLSYKRLTEQLGVCSVEIQMPDNLTNFSTGAVQLRLPNIGIEVFTHGDWKVDIGVPIGEKLRRCALVQLFTCRPFIGWFGFYMAKTELLSHPIKGFLSDKNQLEI